jgi:CubicO group peptidase (beta-lactamase class C family)
MSHRETWGNPEERAVGLNWQIDKTQQGARRIWHTGGTFGFSSFLALYPDLNMGLVLLTNESDALTQSRLTETAEKIFEAIKPE